MRDVVLRPVGAADYEAVASILDAVQPDARRSAVELARDDESLRASRLVSDRVLVEVNGVPAAYGVYGDMDWSADRSVWVAGVRVAPDHRRQGIGTMVHDHIRSTAIERGITRLFAEFDEQSDESVRFARRLGYERVGYAFESWLEIGSSPAAGAEPSRSPGAVAVVPVGELQRTTTDWFERLYELYVGLEADIPSPIPTAPTPEATFRARHVESPNAILDAFFVAVDGDEWVGLTELRRIPLEPTWLQQELTGVRASHRRRGIASHLKRIGIEWASAHGYERIRTSNESTNAGMLAVNEAFGFTREKPMGHWILALQ